MLNSSAVISLIVRSMRMIVVWIAAGWAVAAAYTTAWLCGPPAP